MPSTQEMDRASSPAPAVLIGLNCNALNITTPSTYYTGSKGARKEMQWPSTFLAAVARTFPAPVPSGRPLLPWNAWSFQYWTHRRWPVKYRDLDTTPTPVAPHTRYAMTATKVMLSLGSSGQAVAYIISCHHNFRWCHFIGAQWHLT